MFKKPRSVAQIIGGFTSMIKELQTLAAECDKRIEDANANITFALSVSDSAQTERANALAVAERIFVIVDECGSEDKSVKAA